MVGWEASLPAKYFSPRTNQNTRIETKKKIRVIMFSSYIWHIKLIKIYNFASYTGRVNRSDRECVVKHNYTYVFG